MAARALVRIGLAAGGLLATAGSAEALSFTFSQVAGDTLSGAQAHAFSAAAAAWSAVITDPVAVSIGIGFRDLGTGAGGGAVLGATQPTFGTVSYAGFSNALAADARSDVDRAAVAHLPTAPSPRITLTTAEARALGFATGAVQDGAIEFSSNPRVTFATTRTDLASGRYDLIGTAAHEIGHLLGIRHAPTGLMRASLEAGDIVAFRRGKLRFSPAEARGMRIAAQLAGQDGVRSAAAEPR